MHLFTWYDVELDLKRNRELWPKSWNRVDVYNNEIVINVDAKNNTESENESALKKIFANCYHDGMSRGNLIKVEWMLSMKKERKRTG